MDYATETRNWLKFPFTDSNHTIVAYDGNLLRSLKPSYRLETVFGEHESTSVYAYVPASDLMERYLTGPMANLAPDTEVRVKVARFGYSNSNKEYYRLLVADRIQGTEETIHLPMIHCFNVEKIKQTLLEGGQIPSRSLLMWRFQSVIRDQTRRHTADFKEYMNMLETTTMEADASIGARQNTMRRRRFEAQFQHAGGQAPFRALDYQISDIIRMGQTEFAIDYGKWGITEDSLLTAESGYLKLAPDLYVDQNGSSFLREPPAANRWRTDMQIPIKGGCLFHEPGMGKTFITIANALLRGPRATDRKYGTLILCPATQIGHWVNEIQRCAPTQKVCRISKMVEYSKETALSLEAFDFVVVSLEFITSPVYTRILRTRFNHVSIYPELHTVARNEFALAQNTNNLPLLIQLLPFTRLVMDGAHVLARANGKDNLTSTVYTASQGVKYCWFLTGTPAESVNDEVVDATTNYTRYLSYCGLTEYLMCRRMGQFEIASTVSASDFMQKAFAIRRTFARSGAEIAQFEVRNNAVPLEFTQDELRLYNTTFSKFHTEVRTNQAYGVSATSMVGLQNMTTDCKTVADLKKKLQANFNSRFAAQEKDVVRHTALHDRAQSAYNAFIPVRGASANSFIEAQAVKARLLVEMESSAKNLAAERAKVQNLENQKTYLATIFSKLDDPETRKEQSCCICLGDDLPDVSILVCGHLFCPICIGQWLASSRLCPMCKASTMYRGRKTTYRLRRPLSVPRTPASVFQHMRTEYGVYAATLVREALSLPAGEKAILYSRYRRPIDRLASIFKKELKKGEQCAVLHGSVIDKDNSLTKYLDSPVCRVILVAGQGACIGSLNLEHANTVFLIDMIVKPAELAEVHQEALLRINRISRQKPLEVKWFTVPPSETGTASDSDDSDDDVQHIRYE